MVGIEANKVVNNIDDTISALDGVRKACGNINETTDLPDAFHKVLEKVELVTDTLSYAERHIRTHDQDEQACQEMDPDVESCKTQADSLKRVFRAVVPQANIPRLQRYRMAASNLGGVGKNRVEILMKGILEDVHHLVGKCVIERGASVIKAVDEAQVEKLLKAIEELSAMPPSLSEDASGKSINNYGPGTQNVNAGEGTQNNNTGKGRQFIGQSQYFGTDD
ncbi:hypothetical protein DL98DRAFT_660977 [Cadophora sp. DSE1049]|nr:hypothetical protein DL98DRAFT_660977 [Cadophora sp. DSE1049]